MNKVLHIVVYLILIVAAVALWFEKSLFDKRALLGDRNRALEDYIVKIANTIEKADAPRSMVAPEAKKVQLTKLNADLGCIPFKGLQIGRLKLSVVLFKKIGHFRRVQLLSFDRRNVLLGLRRNH